LTAMDPRYSAVVYMSSTVFYKGGAPDSCDAYSFDSRISGVTLQCCGSGVCAGSALRRSAQFSALICGRCIAWQLDTKVLAHHVADKLAFAVVLSDSWQISQLLDRAAVPYVVLNGYARDFPNARAVIRDSSSEYCAELVAYMKARGMKKMLEVDFERRVDRTFKKLLADGGIIVQRELCKFDNETQHSLSAVREVGYKAVVRFLANNGGHLPDVVLFDDDYLAAGGVVALLQAGIRIPDDVTIVTHANRGDEMLVGIPHCRIVNDPVALGDRVAKYVLAVLDGRSPRPPRNSFHFVAP